MPILSELRVFYEYSCVEPRKACSERKIHMKRLITIILAIIMTLLSTPQKTTDEPPVTAEKTPQTAITVQVEQVPEDNETTAETAFVGEASETGTEVNTKETTATESQVGPKNPRCLLKKKHLRCKKP